MMERAHHNGIKIMMDGMGADLLLTPKSDGKISIKKVIMNLLSGDIKEIVKKSRSFIRLKKERNRNYKIADSVLSDMVELHIPEVDSAKINIPNSLFDIRDDRNGMRWGVATRMPFQDKFFQEFGAGLPYEWKIRNGFTKYIFRQAMRNILPVEILGRKSKQGFTLPDSELMGSPDMRKKVEEIINSESFLSRKYWDGIAVQRFFMDFFIGKEPWNNIFWRILNVEIWLSIYFDDSLDKLP